MRAHYVTKVIIGCLALMAWAVASNSDAQTRRALRRDGVMAPGQPVPETAVVQPAPALPDNTPQPGTALVAPAGTGEQGMEATQMQRGGRLIRGRQLIGMPIWGANHQRLGVIRDFVIDYQGDYPILYFAMAPEIAGWGGDYVIVPFDAFQIGYGQGMAGSFVLDIPLDNLRRAPHLGIDRWNSLRDPQFFSTARQFYRQTERTAARPNIDAGHEKGGQYEQNMRQPSQGQGTPGMRGNEPSDMNRGTQREPGSNSQHQPSLSPTTPGTMPNQPQPEPSSGAGRGTQPSSPATNRGAAPAPPTSNPAPSGSESKAGK